MGKINGIRTSAKIAKLASKKLKDGHSSSQTKKLAGNVLGNRAKKTKK